MAFVPKELIIIRHAESARNVAKGDGIFFSDTASRATIAGLSDAEIPISDLGWAQARAAGTVLAQLPPPDVIYHSGYRRTVDTLTGILEAFPADVSAEIPIRRRLALRERDTGYTFEMANAEAEAAFPWLQPYWRTTGFFFARPPGGESHADVTARLEPELERIFCDHVDERVWIVTHAGILRDFRFLLEDWDYPTVAAALKGPAPRNCSLTTYRSDPAVAGRLALHAYDEILWDPSVVPVT